MKWEKTLNNFKTLSERQEEGRRVMETVLKDLKAMVNPVMGNIVLPYNQIEGVDRVMIKHDF